MIHPDDAVAQGITEGQVVTIGNGRGSIRLHAALFEGLPRGVLVVESIWPNADFVGGEGVNTLTSADVPPPAGGAVFHDTAVWIAADGAA